MSDVLQVFAGPKALAHLRSDGLKPADIVAIPGAAGGPKGLVLNPLDRFLFGRWLPRSGRTVHLLGASIGAWRLAVACLPDADAALATLAQAYIEQRYVHAPGKTPPPAYVTEMFAQALAAQLGGREAEALAHPRWRLHVFTSRGRHLLRSGRTWPSVAGYAGAFVANAVHRRAMGAWIERVLFSDPRDPLPMPLDDYRTHRVALTADNLRPSILASCSIPFWLQPVHDIPGAPRGAYWDGGITDYHLHLRYAAWRSESDRPALVLYPHFQREIVPGWLDKAWRRRHRASPHLDNLIVLAPSPSWIATLPGGKIPDRTDFKHFGDDAPARMAAWRRALAESERLREAFERDVEQGLPQAQPL
jgi:hypothetical protein